MSDTIRIKPAPGLIVRDLETFRPLAADGEDKPRWGWRGQYWMRRLRDGDVVLVNHDPIGPRREA